MLTRLLYLPIRPTLFALFVLCFGELGFGLYLQHGLGLKPCPMCIMQRYALITIGLIALIGGWHERRGKIYSTVILLAALAGGGIAAWQSWLQFNPPGMAQCGPGLEYMLENFPLTQLLPMLFRGAGDCSDPAWVFLGLSIANWSFVNFVMLTVLALWLILRRAK
ncbi:MAG: disulfide bond formation protein B [Azoarcus sp.]|jgi:disulfide bond formation protein DsbB|nr:disulfide bond formation protein B [Azoarcus sp.]